MTKNNGKKHLPLNMHDSLTDLDAMAVHETITHDATKSSFMMEHATNPKTQRHGGLRNP